MENREVIYRHSGTVRVTHWINALVLLVLLMSGLQIFNAHPALYLGAASDFDDPVLAMKAVRSGDELKGITTVFGHRFETTGLFGLGTKRDGSLESRGFPWAVTLPGYRSLAMGRRWHFFFAWVFLFNGLAYLLWSLGSGHLRRDLAPTGQQLKHVGSSIVEHAKLNFPKGEERSAITSCRSSLISSSRSSSCR
jgi:thiosulfate reductase cytochrome b subunit